LIDKRIMQVLREKTNLSLSIIYKRIQEKRQMMGYTITREQAAALVASERGIDISKYLNQEELSVLRKLQPQPPVIIKKAVTTTVTPQAKVIQLDGLEVQDPLLPNRTLGEAVKMTKVYPIIYIFENSVRNIISLVLAKKYGEDWWATRVAKSVKDKVQKRMDKESDNPWHGKRGSAPIFYTSIGDLVSIIKDNWGDFMNLFPSQSWIESKISEIELSRNIIAHNNPLLNRDINRIKVYFEDWEAQLKTVKDKI